MRNTVVNTLIDLGKKDRDITLITGDLGFGVLKPYWEALPDQFINAGIAEQNMTGVAAGMAVEGKKVFTYSIGNFPTLRCLEQIRNDCAYHEANVNVICVGGGYVYGALGMSHHATEDIAALRALPGVSVICPGDAIEAELAVRTIADTKGTEAVKNASTPVSKSLSSAKPTSSEQRIRIKRARRFFPPARFWKRFPPPVTDWRNRAMRWSSTAFRR